ncbi:MAG: hypothetical protein DI535_04785 [Citrobacter freundii]|nr:MAG: hypothetical protein DI535_04785 [Citrobacter freundii]
MPVAYINENLSVKAAYFSASLKNMQSGDKILSGCKVRAETACYPRSKINRVCWRPEELDPADDADLSDRTLNCLFRITIYPYSIPQIPQISVYFQRSICVICGIS